MNRSLRRRLDRVLDRRVADAAEALAGARARWDAAALAAEAASDLLATEARTRVEALRRAPRAPLAWRGEAVARTRARVAALDLRASAARGAAAVAEDACDTARRGLLRALVRRRALARALGGVAGEVP